MKEKILILITLLGLGATTNIVGMDDVTALNAALFEAVKNGNTSLCSSLLAQGAQTHAQDLGGTPLHAAAKRGNSAIIQILLSAGATIDAQNDLGYTPLHYATCYQHEDTARFLVQAGANLDLQTQEGQMALHFALEYGLRRLALFFIKAGANLNLTTQDRVTPLYMVVEKGDKHLTSVLLKAGARVDLYSPLGNPLSKVNKKLMKTYFYAPFIKAVQQDDAAKVKQFLAQGAEVEYYESNYNTPLHHAGWHNAPKSARLLLRSGADIQTKGDVGTTAVHQAAGIKRLLRQYSPAHRADQIK